MSQDLDEIGYSPIPCPLEVQCPPQSSQISGMVMDSGHWLRTSVSIEYLPLILTVPPV